MSENVFKDRLRARRLDLGLSQEELASMIKSSKQVISTYETGARIPKVEMADNIARALRVSLDYLMGNSDAEVSDTPTLESIGASPYSPTHKIPVLGRISAGLPLYADEHVEGYVYTELNGNNEYFALRVQGDSMNNRKIDSGDLVIIRRQDWVENGDIAVVLVDGCDATIKQFFQNDNMITLVPHSSNPGHIPQIYDCKNTDIQILGRLVRSITDF